MYDDLEFTADGMGYTWWLAGPEGASFELMPLEGKHTITDVEKAKRQLRRDRDVVSLRTNWVMSYGGRYFASLRVQVKLMQRTKDMVAEALSPANRERFLSMTLIMQRAMVAKLIESGHISWSIKPR